jgi:hypothetical protein
MSRFVVEYLLDIIALRGGWNAKGGSSGMSRTQLTVTVPSELGQYVEELSAELGMKKSEVVSHALKDLRERRMESLLREGYEERAEHDAELLKEFKYADRESPLPEYAE